MDFLINQLKTTKPENAMDVIKQVCNYAPSLDDALVIIERISRGEDGDLMDVEVLESLKLLLRQNMVRLIVDQLYKEDLDAPVVFCKCFK